MRATIGVIVVLLASAPAPAATAIRASIEKLSQDSVLVARTRCVSVEARFTADRTTIETYVKLETLESMVGTATAELTVLCRGGRVGDKVLRVPGQAKFVAGEEDVVFLRKDPRGAWRVLGWCQGKFRIVRDAEKKTVEAIQDLDGLCFVGGVDGKKPLTTKPERLALADLARRVAAARTPAADDGKSDGDETETTSEGESGDETPDAGESGEKADPGK